MTERYPGSEHEIGSLPATRPPVVRPEEVDELLEGTKHRPRRYALEGGTVVELYTVGALAHILGRVSNTLRAWESDGTIPRSTFAMNNTQKYNRRRLYTREQLDGILRIAKEEGVWIPPDQVGTVTPPRIGPEFKKRVRDLFEAQKGMQP